jgi:predicted SnoaL-like aldol condensation-catalyzing enzyme
MKTRISCMTMSLICLAMVCTTPYGAAQTEVAQTSVIQMFDNMIGLSTPNGRAVYDYFDLRNQGKHKEASDKYMASDVVHHRTGASTKEEPAHPANPHFTVYQLVAQGDLVFVHIFATGGECKLGEEMVQIMRLRDGKIIDIWNLWVPIKDDKSTIFTGMHP